MAIDRSETGKERGEKATRTVQVGQRAARQKGVAFPDMDWFAANYRRLTEEYPDHWLIIKDQQVRAIAATPAELRQRVRELGLEGPFLGRTPRLSDLDLR